MSKKTRTETDSLGALEVPAEALYGAQTQRAVQNFGLSSHVMPQSFIAAVTLIKEAAAKVNGDLGLLPEPMAAAIATAAQQARANLWPEEFPVDVFQTGSGTSTNMNVNEVLATLASTALGTRVNPNDHVNLGQSSNDVIPSAIHLSAALRINAQLLPALEHLASAIEAKMHDVTEVTKTGRTHLMDAMPITLAQELSGWAAQVRSSHARVTACMPRLQKLAQGGTAVGTGINAHPNFPSAMAVELSRLTELKLVPNDNFFESLSSQDTAVETSGQLKTTAVALMKIANDLRWMNSGPLAGIGELELPALQPGSSIMPGKVNPVIPEAVAMACAQVMGNDTTITVAGASGNFQLNVMLPVIAYNLLESIDLLANAAVRLADTCMRGFKVRSDNIEAALERNPIVVTALNPIIGYMQAAEIAKRAYAENRPVLDVADELTELPRSELAALLDPHKLTAGGIVG